MKKEYYNKYPIEVIDMMISVFGVEATANFCMLNAFKYRMRMGLKSENIEDELAKEQWYLNKANELKKDVVHNVKPYIDDNYVQNKWT